MEVLYHTTFTEPIIESDDIKGAIFYSKSGAEAVYAKNTVDATGDGDVCARASVPYEIGNEKLGIIQPATMFFHISNVDSDAVEEDIQKNIDNFYKKDGVNYRSFHWRVKEARDNGEWTLDRVSIGLFRMPKKDEWCVNTSRIMGVDSTDNESLSDAEINGRKQVEEIFSFIKNYIPGCKDARLKSTASYIGIRESRHIKGEYVLTAEDLLNGKVFDDSVFIAANSVDVHGRFGPKSNEYIPINGKYYGVPYRSLIPLKTNNLLMAGRCVSADSTAAGAIRVMPPCMAMGQAAGTAAALSVKNGCDPRELDTYELRSALMNNGAIL